MDSLSQYKVDKKAGSFTSRARYTRNLSSLPFRGKYITDELALKTYRKGLSKKTIGPLDWIEYRELSQGADAFKQIHDGSCVSPKIILIP